MSVVTVCMNSAPVLVEALASLRGQTWPDREWVVIDGGSTDTTLDIVRNSGETLGEWVSEPDSGIYNAMNKGITRSRGDILYFLNSDDALYDQGVLADAAAQFDADPDLDLLFGNVVYVREDWRLLRTYAHIDAQSLFFEDLCHQAVFARRTLFERIGSFDETFRWNADYDWLIRVFRSAAKWKYIDRRIARFRLGGAHGQNPQRLIAERWRVRRQYLSPLHLAFGDLRRRLSHRMQRLSGRLPRGQVALGD